MLQKKSKSIRRVGFSAIHYNEGVRIEHKYRNILQPL